jgi:hypothetical protein
MNTLTAMTKESRVAEELARVAAMAAAMPIICTDNQIRLSQQCLSVRRPPLSGSEVEFMGRVPFGFAFTEGTEATFQIPSGHRFLIEHLVLSCPDEQEMAEVHMVSRSRRMFQHISLISHGDRTAPILVPGFTENTLLFSNGVEPSSSTVPLDTYVQMWGYLEPVDDTASL